MNRIDTRLAAFALVVVPALIGTASPAHAIDIYESDDGEISFAFTGYVQPYLRWVDNPCSYNDEGECTESLKPDGFGLTRARLGFEGDYAERGSFKLELDTVPNVELLEARLRFEPLPWMAITAGRFKVPFSRQELTSESRLQLIDRAALIRATPGRQLGVELELSTGFGRLEDDFLTIAGGIFNGESAKERAPINNIDENFLYAARIEIAPFGNPAFAEGDLRAPADRAEPQLVFGGSWSTETRGENNGDYEQRNLGGDVVFRWHGLSLYGEIFRMDRNYVDAANADFAGFGYNTQLGFFIPARYVDERLEIVARVQEWDPKRPVDAAGEEELRPTSAGNGPAQPDGEQAARAYVGGINWYFAGHDLKLQANYTHYDQLENTVLSASSAAVPLDVDDDTFYLQLTYRF